MATVHTYTYDAPGRLIEDNVTTVGTGIDGAVRPIVYADDGLSRREEVSSCDSGDDRRR